MTQIADLRMRVDTTDLTTAEKKLDSVAKKAKEAQNSSGGLNNQLKRFSEAGGPLGDVADRVSGLKDRAESAIGGVGRLAGGITAVGVAAAAVVVSAVKLALSVADMADAMNDLSNRTNISTERLSLLDAAAKMAGSSAEDLVSSAERLGGKLAKQDEDSGRAATALKELGIATKSAAGEQKSMLQLQEDIIVAASEATDKAKAEGAAVLLLGNDYYKLRTAVLETRQSKGELYDYMQKTGAVVTTKLAKDSDELNDSISKLGLAWKGMANSVSAIVIPILTKVVTAIGNISAAAADVIRRYTGGETASEQVDAALEKMKRERDAAQNTISKIEGTAYSESAQGARALEAARAKVTAINEQIREMQRLKSAADAAAASVKAAVTDGAAGEGNTVTGRPDGPKKANDPTNSESYRQAMRDAQERSRMRNAEYDGINKYLGDQYVKGVEATHKQTEEYLKQAEAIRELIQPMRGLQREIDAINANPALTEDEKVDAVVAASDRYIKAHGDMKKSTDELSISQRISETAFRGLEDGLVTLATTGKMNFKQFIAAMLQDIARLIIQLKVIKPLMESLGGTGGSGGSGGGGWMSAAGTAISAWLGSANGNAFGSSGLLKSAKGNVFDSPTLHGFKGGVGMLGEAGPEAIMPLKRGANGKLGVVAQGGGGQVTVHNHITVTVGSVDSTDRVQELQKSLREIVQVESKKVMADQMRKGGMLNPVR